MRRSHLVFSLLLACLVALPLAVPRSVAAQEAVPKPFLSVTGGAWNIGLGFNPIGRASISAPFSDRVFVEWSVSSRWRPATWGGDPDDRIHYRSAAVGAFVEFPESARTARPFLGVSIGHGRNTGFVSGHLGVRQEVLSGFGVRAEAIGQVALFGAAYELLAGGYLDL